MDELIEASVTAARERDRHGRILSPSSWYDLSPEALDELFERQLLSRALERMADPQGQSTTVKVVMARLR